MGVGQNSPPRRGWDKFYRIGEALSYVWPIVRIDWEGKRLILERDVEDEEAEPDYWPGYGAGE
jgi:hypothetical protein